MLRFRGRKLREIIPFKEGCLFGFIFRSSGSRISRDTRLIPVSAIGDTDAVKVVFVIEVREFLDILSGILIRRIVVTSAE